jgi:hypothetical protein
MNAALGDVDKFGEFSCGNPHVDAPLAVLFRKRLRLKSQYFDRASRIKIPKKKHEGRLCGAATRAAASLVLVCDGVPVICFHMRLHENPVVAGSELSALLDG